MTFAGLQQQETGGSAGGAIFGGLFSLVLLALALVVIVGMWKIFTKAGQPGWASIIPIYNLVILLKIAGKPAWWFLLLLVPVVNIVIAIILAVALARIFGQGAGFAAGMVFLPFTFYPVLGFGDAAYRPVAS